MSYPTLSPEKRRKDGARILSIQEPYLPVLFGEQRQVEGHFGVGLLFDLGIRVAAQSGALGVDADPTAAHTFEDVGKDTFFVYFAGTGLVMKEVGAVSHGEIGRAH